jgi:hypothetical protein
LPGTCIKGIQNDYILLLLKVKTAYQRLLDPQQREVVVMNIQYIRDEAKRERQRLLSKGVLLFSINEE